MPPKKHTTFARQISVILTIIVTLTCIGCGKAEPNANSPGKSNVPAFDQVLPTYAGNGQLTAIEVRFHIPTDYQGETSYEGFTFTINGEVLLAGQLLAQGALKEDFSHPHAITYHLQPSPVWPASGDITLKGTLSLENGQASQLIAHIPMRQPTSDSGT